MIMTEDQKKKCHGIIHGHAVAAAAGNAIPLPGLGVAVDITTMSTMAMSLSAVFEGNIAENVAKNIAIAALKKTLLKQPIKTLTKELSKLIPFAGPVISSSVSVAMLESAGWVMARELEEKCKEAKR